MNPLTQGASAGFIGGPAAVRAIVIAVGVFDKDESQGRIGSQHPHGGITLPLCLEVKDDGNAIIGGEDGNGGGGWDGVGVHVRHLNKWF